MMKSSQRYKVFGKFFGILQGILQKFSNSGKNCRVNLKLFQIVSGLLQDIVYW